jgi:hypothetical protein
MDILNITVMVSLLNNLFTFGNACVCVCVNSTWHINCYYAFTVTQIVGPIFFKIVLE